MSDSGRSLGECKHARDPQWCFDCLQERIKKLEAELASWPTCYICKERYPKHTFNCPDR